MKRWVKIATLVLGLLTVFLIGFSYVEHTKYVSTYEDLRDYYPLGSWIKAHRLTEQPETWVELENDTYIAQAVRGEQNLTFTPINTEYDWTKDLIEGGWVWFKEDDPNSEFRKKGKPLYILGIPNGNYYKLDMFHVDGIPEYFKYLHKYLPPPLETTALLSIAWAIFTGVAMIDHKTKRGSGGDLSWKDLVVKYFIHGIAFSVLFLILGIAWAFVTALLVVIGFIIGLIIGVCLLFLIVGFLNSVITSFLWFEVKTSFWDLFFHGLVLFIILLVVNGIFVGVPSLVFPGIVTTLTTLVISTFLNGFVGKKVAGWWKQEYREGIPEAIEAEWRDRKL